MSASKKMDVVTLTREICERFGLEGETALCGDGTCSLSNMETSCFASERCMTSRRCGIMTLTDMMDADMKYACIVDGRFGGCIVASLCSKFPHIFMRFPEVTRDSYLVCNFCVAPHLRGKGVGKVLMRKVLLQRRPTYLTVLLPCSHADAELRELMRARSSNLEAMYTRMGFRAVDRREHLLMRYEGESELL